MGEVWRPAVRGSREWRRWSVTDLHLTAVEIWDYEAAGWEEVPPVDYEVDFIKKLQTNLGTGTVRRIRRVVLWQQHDGTKSK